MHSKIGASSMYRWSNCPGSVGLLEKNPMPTSKYAEEGTLAHEACEVKLKQELKVDDELTVMPEITAEMQEHVDFYVDYCLDLCRFSDGMAIEQGFRLTEIDDRAFGTNDFSCWTDFEELHIVDFKYGAGIEVQAEGNRQLMYYALGCVMENDLDVNEIYLHVVQPRVEDSVKVHKISYGELMEFKAELISAIERVDNEPETYVPGDHCRFCSQSMCAKFREHMHDQAAVNVDETIALPDPNEFPIDKLMNSYAMISQVNAFIKNVEAVVMDKATRGEIDLPQYDKKLVKKFSNRKWKGDIPYRKLGLKKGDVYKTVEKELSPAQVEKLLDKEMKGKVEEFTERTETGAKIVSSKAKGEPLELTAPETLTIN